jgi:hypothetical protein
MAEPPKPQPEADKDDAADEKEAGYSAKYIRSSKVKELFVEGEEKIRISGEAKGEVWKFLDEWVAKGVKQIIKNMPRISKGENTGKLKRITVMKEDMANMPK